MKKSYSACCLGSLLGGKLRKCLLLKARQARGVSPTQTFLPSAGLLLLLIVATGKAVATPSLFRFTPRRRGWSLPSPVSKPSSFSFYPPRESRRACFVTVLFCLEHSFVGKV